MAGGAGSHYLGVVHLGGWLPGCTRMATLASGGRGDVQGRLTLGRGAIVANRTGADDLQVINLGYGFPGSRSVTGIAGGRRTNVRGGFASGYHAIVAA